jgi:hypothetical protein
MKKESEAYEITTVSVYPSQILFNLSINLSSETI